MHIGPANINEHNLYINFEGPPHTDTGKDVFGRAGFKEWKALYFQRINWINFFSI